MRQEIIVQEKGKVEREKGERTEKRRKDEVKAKLCRKKRSWRGERIGEKIRGFRMHRAQVRITYDE